MSRGVKKSTGDSFATTCVLRILWSLLGCALFGMPLIWGSPGGPWTGGGFGTFSYLLALSFVLLPGVLGKVRSLPVASLMGALAGIVCALLLMEVHATRVYAAQGVGGLLDYHVFIGRLFSMPLSSTLPVAEKALSTLGLLLWVATGSHPQILRSAGGTREMSSLRLSLTLVASLLLGLVARAMPSLMLSRSDGNDFEPVVAACLVSAGFCVFVCLVVQLYSAPLAIRTPNATTVHMGRGSRVTGIAVLVGALVYSVFDVLAWPLHPIVDNETVDHFFVAFIGLLTGLILTAVLAALSSRGTLLGENSGKASGPDLTDTSQSSSHAPQRFLPQLADLLPGVETLSARELSVIEGTLSGESQTQMAQASGVSVSTIGSYRARAYRKLGVTTKQELIALVKRELGPAENSSSPSMNAEKDNGEPGNLNRSKMIARAFSMTLAMVLWTSSSFAAVPATFERAGFLMGVGLFCLTNALALASNRTPLAYGRGGKKGPDILTIAGSTASALLSFCSLASYLAVNWNQRIVSSSLLSLALFLAGLTFAYTLPGVLCQVKDELEELQDDARVRTRCIAVACGVTIAISMLSHMVAFGSVVLIWVAWIPYAILTRREKVPNPRGQESPSTESVAKSDASNNSSPRATSWCALLYLAALLCSFGLRLASALAAPLGALGVIALCCGTGPEEGGASRRSLLLGYATGCLSLLGLPTISLDTGIVAIAIQIAPLVTVLFAPRAISAPSTSQSLDERRVNGYLIGKGLSEVQAQIVILTLFGYNSTSIAERLVLSPHTVKSYRALAYDRLGVRGKRGLVSLINKEVL